MLLNLLSLDQLEHFRLFGLPLAPKVLVHGLPQLDEFGHQSVCFVQPSVVDLLGPDRFSLVEVELRMVDGHLPPHSEFLLIFLFFVLNHLFFLPLQFFQDENRAGPSEILVLHQGLVLFFACLGWIRSRLELTVVILAKVALESFDIEPVILVVVGSEHIDPRFLHILLPLQNEGVHPYFLQSTPLRLLCFLALSGDAPFDFSVAAAEKRRRKIFAGGVLVADMLADVEGEGAFAVLGGSIEDDSGSLQAVFGSAFWELVEGVSLGLMVFIAISSQTKHCL